jgi:hypothetical protein
MTNFVKNDKLQKGGTKMFSNTKRSLFQAVLGIGICLLLVIFIGHDAPADDAWCPDYCSRGTMTNHSISADGKCTFTFTGYCPISSGTDNQFVRTFTWTIDASWDGNNKATETLHYEDYCFTRFYYCSGNLNPWLNDVSCQVQSVQRCGGWLKCSQVLDALAYRIPWTPALLSPQDKAGLRAELESKQQQQAQQEQQQAIQQATPKAPSDLKATVGWTSGSQTPDIRLTWKDNSPPSAFIIYRLGPGDFGYKRISYTGATSYLDLGLPPGTYNYQVKAVHHAPNTNQPLESDYSNVASATIPSPPLPPSDLEAKTISHGQIALTWKASSNSGDGYQIERRKWGESHYAKVKMVGAQATNYTDSGLNLDTTYFYRVRTFYTYGYYSPYSNEAHAKTLPKDIKPSSTPSVGKVSMAKPLLPPSDLKAKAVSHGQIALSWKAPSNPGDGYRIERKKTGEQYKEINIVWVQATDYKDSGLSPDTTYFYRVRTYKIEGGAGLAADDAYYEFSPYSKEAQATTMPMDIKPSAPPAGKVKMNVPK